MDLRCSVSDVRLRQYEPMQTLEVLLFLHEDNPSHRLCISIQTTYVYVINFSKQLNKTSQVKSRSICIRVRFQ